MWTKQLQIIFSHVGYLLIIELNFETFHSFPFEILNNLDYLLGCNCSHHFHAFIIIVWCLFFRNYFILCINLNLFGNLAFYTFMFQILLDLRNCLQLLLILDWLLLFFIQWWFRLLIYYIDYFRFLDFSASVQFNFPNNLSFFGTFRVNRLT